MSKADEFKEQYEEGYKIFEQLFKLSDKELKEKLKSVIRLYPNDISNTDNKIRLVENGSVRRIICNEKCEEITIAYYDYLTISALGISYCAEHGSGKLLIPFNKHFKL